jgi:hypothetical protein
MQGKHSEYSQRKLSSATKKIKSAAMLAIVLSFGATHGTAIATSTDFIVKSIAIIVFIVLLYTLQRFVVKKIDDCLERDRKCQLLWWSKLIDASTFLQQYLITTLTYVANITLLPSVTDDIFTAAHLVWLLVVFLVFVFVPDTVPNLISGGWKS